MIYHEDTKASEAKGTPVYKNIEGHSGVVDHGHFYRVSWDDGSSLDVPADSPNGILITGLIAATAKAQKLAIPVVQPILQQIAGKMDRRAAKAVLNDLLKSVDKGKK